LTTHAWLWPQSFIELSKENTGDCRFLPQLRPSVQPHASTARHLILALLTLAGQFCRSDADQQRAGANQAALGRRRRGGAIAMLSVDQFLRLICVPAILVAFVIASQFSGAFTARPALVELARK
jgi:hypothetical protein